MIGRIQGKLSEASENQILVNVGGVCYELEVTANVLAQLPGAGDDVALYTHFVVREDAQLLYGFASRMERDIFRDLIRISGVGPKLGLSLLSGISLEQLAMCVDTNDASMLTRVPGIGKKTAQRLLVELKDRLTSFISQPAVQLPSDLTAVSDAESALVALGYRPLEARNAIAGVRSGADDGSGERLLGTEELVRLALQGIARQVEVPS